MQVILSCHSYRLFRMARNGSTEKEKGTHIANTEVPCGISCIVVVGGRFFLEGFYWEGPTNYSPPALKKKKKKKLEISSRTLIALFWLGSVRSDSASRGDCRRVFLGELRVGSIP